MSWLLLAAIATGSSAIILVLANAYLYAFLRERFIKAWTVAWGSFALGHLLMAAGLIWGAGVLAVAAYYFCLLASCIFLLSGTLQFLGRPPTKWPALAGALLALCSGAALALGLPAIYSMLPVFGFLAFSYLFAGRQILQHALHEGIANRGVAWLFIFWGGQQAYYPFLDSAAPWSLLAGSFLALSVAVGMILWYFEKTHRALQNKRERYRDLIESSHEWIWEIDADGRFAYASRLIVNILGYTADEILGKTPYDLMPEAEVMRVSAVLMDICTRRAPFKGLEYVLRRKDQRLIVLETSGVPFFDDQGNFLGYRGMGQDITERKQAENALRESVEKHRIILQTAMDGFWLVDTQGRLLEVNETFCLMSGYSAEELLTMHISDLEVCETPTDIAACISEIITGGNARFETRHRRKDGRIIDVEVSVQFRQIEEGRCIAFLRDITERKKAEVALKESEFFFKESQRSASIGSYKADFVANSWDSSEILDAIFGIDKHYRRDVPGWLDIVHPDDRTMLDRYLRHEVISGGQPFSKEYRIIRKNDGETRWVCGLGAVTCDALGTASTLIGTIQDITERKHAEQEREQLERQLLHAQKLESLGVLAGGIAHDFNNILTSIVGNADLALRRIDRDSPVVENLTKIEQASARAADLAKQMLAYSGKGKFIVENIDLNRLLEEMLHMLEVSISKKAELRFNLHDSLPAIGADATQLRQIIMNLVINASEAIGEENGFIAVTTDCRYCEGSYLKGVWLDENLADGLYVVLEIADSGCGMDGKTLAKIFDPFFTTKFTGRGLGMAAVLGIVRGHKGAIKVNSEPGHGTVFKILLPASDSPAEMDDRASGCDGWQGAGKVLLVDDEESVRDIGREMLQELGYTALTAGDGVEAMEIFRSNPEVKFVILDLNMPHMDGEQCFYQLRELRPEVTILMSSGYDEQEVCRKFVGKGLAGFVQKPYTFEMLSRAFYRLST